jgi:hypothetical protein
MVAVAMSQQRRNCLVPNTRRLDRKKKAECTHTMQYSAVKWVELGPSSWSEVSQAQKILHTFAHMQNRDQKRYDLIVEGLLGANAGVGVD